ncbi:MAG: ABC transporter substrate-binding protein [Succinivibrionaceae bacterium]
MRYIFTNFILYALVLLCLTNNSVYANSNNRGIIFCSDSKIPNTNPQRFNISSMASSLSYAIYDRLQELNTINKKITDAVGSLEYINDNGKTYVFRINKGYRFHSNEFFHPTRELNAHDVAFSFDRMINPKNPFYNPKEYFPYFADSEINTLLYSVKALSDELVEFKLKKSSALLIPFLATDNSVILSKEYADKILSDHLPIETLDYFAIGTGPYRQQKFIRERFVRMYPFKNYHGKEQKIKPLVFTNSPHLNKRLFQMYTNECNIISNPTASQLAFLHRHSKHFNILEKSSILGTFLIFNTKQQLFDTREERNAINSLIKQKKLNETVYFGQGYYISDLINNFQVTLTLHDLDYHNIGSNINLNSQPFTTPEILNTTKYNFKKSHTTQEQNNKYYLSIDNVKINEHSDHNHNNDNFSNESNFNEPYFSKNDYHKNPDFKITYNDLKSNNQSFNINDYIFKSNIIDKYDNNKFKEPPGENNYKYNYFNDLSNPNRDNQDHYNLAKKIVISKEEIKKILNNFKNKTIEIAIFDRNTIVANTHLKIAQFLKSSFEKEGITVKIKNYNSHDFNRLEKGNFDIALITIYSDYSNILEPLITCNTDYNRLGYTPKNTQINYSQNFSGWCNENIDKYYRDLSLITDYNSRKTIKYNINTLLHNELPIIPLIYTINKFISQKNIVNLKQTPYGGLSFIDTTIEGDL